MTRERIHGMDSPFSAWVRDQGNGTGLLHSLLDSFTLNDIDWMIHCYRTRVNGGKTRDVNLMMNLEVKSHGAIPSSSQQETLFFHHQLLKRKTKLLLNDGTKRTVWHFGFYVLSMDGETPDEAGSMRWMRFNKNGELIPTRIKQNQLLLLLKMDYRPDTFRKMDLRLHHKTQELLETIRTPLGFEVQKLVIKRS